MRKNTRAGSGFIWVCMILSAACTAFVFFAVETLDRRDLLGHRPSRCGFPSSSFRLLFHSILAAQILRSAAGYGQAYLIGYIGQQVIQKLRNQLYQHFLSLPMRFSTPNVRENWPRASPSDVQRLQDSITNVVVDGHTNPASMALSLVGSSFITTGNWLSGAHLFPLGALSHLSFWPQDSSCLRGRPAIIG